MMMNEQHKHTPTNAESCAVVKLHDAQLLKGREQAVTPRAKAADPEGFDTGVQRTTAFTSASFAFSSSQIILFIRTSATHAAGIPQGNSRDGFRCLPEFTVR